jgi:transposase
MMTTSNGKSPASPEIVLKPRRRRISVSEKLRILKAVEAAAPGKQGEILRREGVYSSQVSTWRQQLERGDLDAANLRVREQSKGDAKAASRRVAQLEGEVRRLKRRLERAELIGEIQKKAARLLGMDLESRETDDER